MQPTLIRIADEHPGPFTNRFEALQFIDLRRVVFLAGGDSGRAARYFFDRNFCLNLGHKTGARRPTQKRIAKNASETTNNIVVLSHLFPLQVGAARTPSPPYCGWAAELPSPIFGALTVRLLAQKIDSLYACPNAFGSTLDFGVFCG